MTSFTKELAAERKRLSAAADPKPIERLRAEQASLKPQHEAACTLARDAPAGSAEASALGRRLTAIDMAIRAADETRSDAVARLHNIDRWLGAAARAEAARVAVDRAQAVVDEVQRRLAAVDQGIERLAEQRAKAAAAAQVEINALAAHALAAAGLGDSDLAGTPGAGSAGASASPQVAAVAAAETLAKAERLALGAKLDTARAALRDVDQVRREAQADAAELRHLESLADMLTAVMPALRAYREASHAAGREMRLPDFDVLLAEADGEGEGESDPVKRLIELCR